MVANGNTASTYASVIGMSLSPLLTLSETFSVDRTLGPIAVSLNPSFEGS